MLYYTSFQRKKIFNVLAQKQEVAENLRKKTLILFSNPLAGEKFYERDFEGYLKNWPSQKSQFKQVQISGVNVLTHYNIEVTQNKIIWKFASGELLEFCKAVSFFVGPTKGLAYNQDGKFIGAFSYSPNNGLITEFEEEERYKKLVFILEETKEEKAETKEEKVETKEEK